MQPAYNLTAFQTLSGMLPKLHRAVDMQDGIGGAEAQGALQGGQRVSSMCLCAHTQALGLKRQEARVRPEAWDVGASSDTCGPPVSHMCSLGGL